MRIIVAATPAVAIPTLDALLASDHELVSVITRPDAPAGRGRSLQATEVSNWAQSHGLLVHKPADKEALRELVKGAELVVTIGYGRLIPIDILEIPRYGFINLHLQNSSPGRKILTPGHGSFGRANLAENQRRPGRFC